MIWSVYNGWCGNGAVAVLVEADSEKEAFEMAVDALRAEEEKWTDYWTPSPSWSADQLAFPYVVELS